ncbi:MAG: beta-galactosidase [Armatimonadota bacterium]
MADSVIVNDRLIVNGSPLYVCGAEIQYFRLPVSTWHDRLEKARDGGINTVSSYMPWYWHEPVEGQIDLTGETKPERSLRHFLDLNAELGLKVFARPGPFVNSELRYGGMPGWLFRDHPETLSHTAHGITTGRPIPAEGEPLYRQFVRNWFRQVNALLAEYDIRNGGPIILYQPDNELSAAWSYGLLNSLYDPTILAEFWPKWLRDTYRDIAVLNVRYGTAYREFTEADAPREFATMATEKLRCLDWLNFKRWFFADWGATMAQWAIEDGISVPMIFNEPVAGFYGHGDHPGFGKEMRKRGLTGACACHTYSDRLIDLEGAIGTAQGVELVKASPWGGPPMAVEVNTKWYMPRLNRTDLNWEPLMRLGFAHGLQGSMIYTYTAETASLVDNIEGPEYFDPSGLDMHGNPSEGYRQLQRFYHFTHAWSDEIADARMVADVTIGFTPGQRLLDFLGVPPLLAVKASGQGPGGERFDAEPTLDKSAGSPSHDWLDGYEGVSKQSTPAEAGVWKRNKEAALLLTRLNVSYDMLELTSPNRAPGSGWIIIPCTGSLDKAAITYCLEHLDAGGGLLFFPTIPVFDEDGAADLRLTERLGLQLVAQIRPAGGEVMDYGTRLLTAAGKEVGVNGWIYRHRFPQGSQSLAEYDGDPVIVRLPAQCGKVVVAGTDMSYTSLSVLALWQRVVQEGMGIQPVVTSAGNYYHGLLLKGEQTSIFTVLNLTGQVAPGTLTLPQPAAGIDGLSIPLDLRPHEARCLLIGARVGETRLLYSTSEILPLNSERTRLELHGQVGTPGELVFAEPVSGKLNGQDVITLPVETGHIISYQHELTPLLFEM